MRDGELQENINKKAKKGDLIQKCNWKRCLNNHIRERRSHPGRARCFYPGR